MKRFQSRAMLLGCLLFVLATPAMTGPAGAAVSIEILAPGPGNVTDLPTVLVAGNATPGASVAVNGVLVHVQADGSWSLQVALADGMNTILAEAWDAGGNQSNASVEIEFRDPALDAAADLLDAMDELATTQEDLNWTQALLAEAEADLADALANVSELQAELAATQADLAATQVELVATQADLAATQADLAEAQAEVVALNADLEATNAQLEAEGALAEEGLRRADQAKASADTASLLAVVGIAVGAGAAAMAFLTSRRHFERDHELPVDRR